jgi:hypothetical protein
MWAQSGRTINSLVEESPISGLDDLLSSDDADIHRNGAMFLDDSTLAASMLIVYLVSNGHEQRQISASISVASILMKKRRELR